MTHITLGDLVIDDGGDAGIVSLIETDKGYTLYFVHWTSGGLTGYTTAHKPKQIMRWTKNVRLHT